MVTLKTSLLAQLLILVFGTPTAFLLATRRFPGRSLAITLVELPLVLPPAVAGIGLLAAFGRFGLLGSSLEWLGITLPFTQTAVTLAVAYVPRPLYVRQAIAAFEAIDPNLAAASRTLGAGPARTFFRVMLPLARGGLIAGLALSFARGLGEFGATIMFAGSLQARDTDAAARDLRRVRPGLRRDARDERRCSSLQHRPPGDAPVVLSWQTSSSTRSPFRFGLSTLRADARRSAGRSRSSGRPAPARRPILRAVAGLARPARGTHRRRRRRLVRRRAQATSPARGPRVGLVFQDTRSSRT